MDKQAKEARELTKQLKGKEKWRNFWYYYKYHVLIGIFTVVLISFTLVECLHRVNYDLNVSCYSGTYIDDEASDILTKELEKNIDDITGNGKKEANISVNMANFSDASEQNQAVIMKLAAELAGGDAFGYIFDEEFYNFIKDSYSECFDAVIPISTIPIVKEAFGLNDGSQLYWATKALYEAEKNKPEKIAAHKNAAKIQNYFETLVK